MLLILAVLVFGSTTAYHYEAGYEHHYTYSSTTDTIGMHNITTVMKFRVQMISERDNGTKFHRLTVDSFVQHSQSGQYADNPFHWDLAKSFLFEMEPNGLVNFIHYHPEEKDELVTLKKALVGTMSAKFKKSRDDTWRYTSKETDHGGHLSHVYEARKTDSGSVVKRYHRSATDVIRTHQKEIHIDHNGNIKKILASDNITMNGDKPTKRHTLGTPLADKDKDLKVYSTGEFPVISATGETNVHLTLKRKITGTQPLVEDNLIRDTIVVTQKPPEKKTLVESGDKINSLIKCVLSHENKYAPNRTVCVGNLTRAVLRLEKEDFVTFAKTTLNKTCKFSETKCLEKRYLVLDVIAQAKTNVSQQIIVDHVLSVNTSEEEVRRSLIHCTAVQQPVKNLILAVECLCFGKDDKFHGVGNMTLTQKRACLTLGALSKHLRDLGDDIEAQRIVKKFERWLGVHNESEFNGIVKPREKRSVGRGISYHDRDLHVALKRTLLHCLGNAGHPRSLRHITSYLELNKANAELRRTAAHALRHFTCNESAAHLLRSTLFDSEDVVRHGAYEIYIEHPQSKQLTREQEEAVLEQRYTYPVITRIRRASFADILKALSFHLGMPKFQWDKTIGSSKLGASFGMRMENFVDLQLEPFKGKFELKVDNLAYARVDVGLINQHYDIFKVLVCYKTKFGYNLNVLKDYGFNAIQELASAFDKIFHQVIDPIVDAVKTIAELIEMVRDETFSKLVGIIIDLFKHLPEIIRDIVNRIRETYKKLTDFDGFPLINKFKKLVNRITTFILDIKSDVMEFYHSIADAMTVTLPFVGNEMGEGFKLIKDSWEFWEHPMDSMQGIEMALLKFKLAVGTFIEAKNRIMDACFFAKGRTPYWFHPGEEIHGILHDLNGIMVESWEEFKDMKHDLNEKMRESWEKLKDMKPVLSEKMKGTWEKLKDLKPDSNEEMMETWEKLKDLKLHLNETMRETWEEFKNLMHHQGSAKQHVQDLAPVQITDGFNVNGTHNSIKLVIHEAVDVLKDRLNGTLNIAAPFWDKITHLMELFKRIKTAYTTLHEVVNKGKYYLQKLFGSKFHRKFPKIPAPCESESCGCGEYSQIDEKGRFGLHLNFKRKIFKKVVNPFVGTVYRLSDTEVLIRPFRVDVVMYEVVVSGFEVDSHLDEEKKGVFLRAGKRIGKAKDAGDCESGSFVFVSMRKRPNDTENAESIPEDSYEYIDPSPYLKRRFPKPGHKPLCKDFSFFYIGMVTENGDMSGDPDDNEEDIHRSGDGGSSRHPFSHALGHKLGKRSAEQPPENHPWTEKLKGKFHNMTGKFDKYKNMLSKTYKSILPSFDVNDKSLSTIKDLVKDTPFVQQLDDVAKQVAKKLQEEPLGYPDEMPIHQIRRRLKKAHEFDIITGDRLSMIDTLMDNAVEECSSFNESIVRGYGHYCEAHEDCNGITCSIGFIEGFQRHVVKVDLRMDTCNHEILLTVHNRTEKFAIRVQKDIMIVDVLKNEFKELVFDIEIEDSPKKTSDEESPTFHVTLSGALCVSTHYSCFEDVGIFWKLPLQNKTDLKCHKDESIDPFLDRVYGMNLPDLIEEVSEFGLDMKHCLIIVNEIRNAILDALMWKNDTKEDFGGSEFPDKEDFCFESGVISPGNFDSEIINPCPHFVPPFICMHEPGIHFKFMVGPIPLRLSFGAHARLGVDLEFNMCLMRMEAKAMVTPHIGASVWGELNVDIGFAYGGIRLEGHLLDTRFSITAEFGFAKFPIDITFKLDLVIIPLELRLKAHARVRLLFVTVTVFDACLWKYKTPTYKTNLYTLPHKKRGPGKVDMKPTSVSPRNKRSSPTGGCEVKQIEGRDPTDTAFLLEVSAKSNVSDIKLSYAIGTHESGTNVLAWTGMTGSSLTAPLKLGKEHYGIPLYFIIKAKISQGDETTTQCKLRTYDNTVPDGRIDESYPYTSHPHKISGNIVVFDDSDLVDSHLEAVGTSVGQFGAEIVPWQTLRLQTTSERTDSTASVQMKSFTIGKEGKLTGDKITTSKTDHVEKCAAKCLHFGTKCVSFDYEHHSETCDLHSTIEGPNSDVRISGTYKHYERLGVGYSSFVEHNLDLQHGTVYILNAEIENVLGYKGYVSLNGTIADHTPPEPGPINRASLDEIRFDGCKAAITQRCIELTNLPNHRRIIDGPGSTTVFNGHTGGVDTLYTLANHFMSGNWNGFKDNETGIYGYTWAVGTSVCGTDIADFSDPHAHLSSPKFWTNTGYVRNLHLPDGKYYITVQAINNVIHGGAMVTTVCHSTPITVDTTPPVFTRGISDDDIVFDEDFDLMALYFDTFDLGSKVKNIDFGLGLTKHDVDVRGYSTYPYKENKSFIVVDDLNLASGEPVWIRLRSVNEVDLFTTAHSDNPILIDRTAPVAGHVLDGEIMDEDLTYQSDNTKICAQWKKFYDPESGINEYRWGVGTRPGLDDIVKHTTYSRDHNQACSHVPLKHNQTYYSSVRAKNSALNPKMVEAYSNGVLIDTTVPVKGWIVDGDAGHGHDMEFSSETAEVAAMWGGFSDPESGIVSYIVEVHINDDPPQSFDNGLKTKFVDYSLSMKHGDHVFIRLTAKNGADVTSIVDSNGFVIDQTPPVVKYLHDTEDGMHYQIDATQLHLRWEFEDQESGMKEYRCHIEDFIHGSGIKFYPNNSDYITLPVHNKTTVNVVLSGLNLSSGHKYSVKVTALNHADMPISLQSPGVMIDSSSPKLEKVHLGLQSLPEEMTEDNKYIEHDDQHSMTLTWSSFDYQSGIVKSFVAIGTSFSDTSVTNGFKKFGPDPKAVLNDLNLKPVSTNDPDPVYYYVQVKVQNGAGMFSEIQNLSYPIKVLKDNVPGTVFDGRQDSEDSDYTIDRTSLGMSFVGFESQQCGIVGYQWAVGSQPFYYDVLPFTTYGIVLINDTHGHGQIHLRLYEGSTYYITVRAQTGHRCKEDYIISCSDGIMLDTTPPTVRMVQFGDEKINPESITASLYQNRTDSLDFKWESSDASGIAENWWSIGSLPGKHDIHPVTVTKETYIPAGTVSFKHGQTFYLNNGARDHAGNKHMVTSPPVTVDTSIPEIVNLTCTPYISVLKSLVTCQWDMIKEYESTIKNFTVGVGSEEIKTDISLFHKQSIVKRNWIRDLLTRIKNNNLTSIYIIFKLENVLGMAKTLPFKVIVDRTVPIGGLVDIVTTIDINGPIQKQDCQIPLSFVEFTVDGWKDEHSDIDRYEAAIGSNGRTSNIQDFTSLTVKDVKVKEKVLITDLDIDDGSSVTVTLRAYNKAGLYAQVTSNPVIVSLVPKLEVLDGISKDDEDYQTSLNVIQGRWRYSDRCKIISADWSVEDIAGNVLQEFTPLPSAINRFYSDVMNLTNGRTYINIIRTVNALNRSRISRSDGIAVKIEPPIPGDVRDGESEDLNYQESIHELYVNWDPFGDSKSRDSTQKIQRYEVAIGTDRRYASTRSNVHYYIDVGLNTSHVFKNLNLTAKTVTYYMTVRGYSFAGSYQEESSNGVKVGYHDEIFPGVVEYSPVQSYTDKLYVSWNGFQADMGIDKFRVGVSTFKPWQLPNDTLSCKLYDEMLPVFNTVNLHDVGVDTFTEMTNLSLIHGHEYYVTVIAMDTTERCMGSYGPPLMIDITPPEPGVLHLPGGTGPNVAYVFDPQRLEISWTEFTDPESHVSIYELKLYSGITCFDTGEVPVKDFGEMYSVIRSEEITHDLRMEFYDLNLNSKFTYLVVVTAVNGAGLRTTVRSLPVHLDTTPPIPGVVKMGKDWKTDISFQSNANTMEGMVGIAYTEKASKCPRSIQVFPPSNAKSGVVALGMDFDSECVVKTKDKISLFIRHDDKLQHLIKGGIKLSLEKILEGNYSAVFKAATGDHMITSWFLASSFDGILTDFTFEPPENDTNVKMEDIRGGLDAEVNILTSRTHERTSSSPTTRYAETSTVDNSTDDSTSYNNEWNRTVTTENIYTNITRESIYAVYGTTESKQTTLDYHSSKKLLTTPGQQFRRKVLNKTSDELGFALSDQYGIGFHIPGYQMEGKWYGYVWKRDKYKTISQQIKLKFDPTSSYNNFIVSLGKVVTPVTTTWSIHMFLNGEIIAQFNGVGLQETGVSGIYTWNKDNFFPPVTDFLNPFIGEAIITSITVPLAKTDDMKCSHGAGFYDGESGIKELWVGISDTINDTDSISPMMLYKSFCNPCQPGCNIGCETSCTDGHTEDFQIIDVKVGNLTLNAATVDRTQKNSDSQLNATTYFYNILAINYAGRETFARSKGVMIDSTPPDLQYVRCVDPSNSMDEPSEFQGTSSSIGAYWECSEDVGDIVQYRIQIGSKPGESDIKSQVSVGLTKKLEVTGLSGKLQHDHTYYFTVTVVNSAGLVSQDSCNVTVEILPPDVSNVTLTYMYSDDVMDDTVLTADNKNIGLQWDGGKDDVAFYEWEIGSEPETDDVFPRIKVGITDSRKAFIKDGKLWIDKTPLNISVGEFANKSWSNESVHEAQSNTFFVLEPGKCVYVTLYAVGRSHLSSSVRSEPLCIKRNEDQDLSLRPPTDHRKRTGTKQHGEIKLQDTETGLSADIIIKGTNITMLGGVLSKDDVTADYGTAASDKYNRYLINPMSRWNDTSRFLRNRLKQYAGIMFYLSPSTTVESLRENKINVKFDSSMFDPNTDLPVLIYWDNVAELWKHPQDTCKGVQDITDYKGSMFSTKLCKEVFMKFEVDHPDRKKSSAALHIPVPRMWSLMLMSRRAPNTQPRILTTDLFATEDMDDAQNQNGTMTIQYLDGEMDTVEFSIVELKHGEANITADGEIHYFPPKDFNGIDYVVVKVVETGLLPPFHPLFSTRNITVHVKPANDAPIILPFDSDLVFEEIDVQGSGMKIVSILLEGNVTKSHDLGHVTFFDVDFVDPSSNEINFTMRTTNQQLANLTFEPVKFHGIRKKIFRVRLSLDKEFNGQMTLSVRGFDQARFTTKMMEVNVYILLSPCVHGNCLNITSTQCDDKERAMTFEKYVCQCDVGYTDQWCQTDINECDPNPCSVFYDCEDLIGYQKCNLNVVKTILLTFAVALTLVMCFILIRRYFKKKRPSKIDPGYNIWSFGKEFLGQEKGKAFKPSTFSFTEPADDIRPSPSHGLTTASDINVGIGSALPDGQTSPKQEMKEKPKRFILFSEKTMELFDRTLQPVTASYVSQKAPHHMLFTTKDDSTAPELKRNQHKSKPMKLPPIDVSGNQEATVKEFSLASGDNSTD